MKTTVFKFAAIAVFTLAGAVGADAKSCKPKAVKAISSAILTPYPFMSKTAAQHWARQAWDKRCDQLYPGVWCDRSIANNRKMVCNRPPNGIGGRTNVCEYTAIPCRN